MAGARRLAEIAAVRCRVGLVGAMVALLLVTIGALDATTTAAGSLVDGEMPLPVGAADMQVSGEHLALRGGTTEALDEYDDRSHTARAVARLAGQGVAPQTADSFVDLASAARRSHILEGKVLPGGRYSGGHRAGIGFPTKSEFPASWSDDQIMHHISDIATDPTLKWRPGRGGDFWVSGTRDGIDIDVLMRNNEIWTAYPTNLGRNPG